jgi:uncharacterized protein (DUF1778 family)
VNMDEAADRRHWVLPPEVFDAMVETLDQPGDPEKLVKLFSRPSPFTKDCE